jgi:hypothetical protein
VNWKTEGWLAKLFATVASQFVSTDDLMMSAHC